MLIRKVAQTLGRGICGWGCNGLVAVYKTSIWREVFSSGVSLVLILDAMQPADSPQSSNSCLFRPTVIVPQAHWEAYGRGSLPLQTFRLSQSSLCVRSATTVFCGIIVALDSFDP